MEEEKTIIEEQEFRNKLRIERDADDLKFILKSKQGRRFIWRLLTLCRVFNISYVSQDTHATAFNEGQRNIGNQLMSELTVQEIDLTRLRKDYEEDV